MTLLNLFFRKRHAAYRNTFNNPEGRKVLADLRRFCRATLPTADVNNVHTTYLQEGRREVFLRIMAHLQLTEEDVFKLIEDQDE
jgi:hypothetical protein